MPVIEQKTTNKNKVDFDLNRLDKSKTTIFSKYPKNPAPLWGKFCPLDGKKPAPHPALARIDDLPDSSSDGRAGAVPHFLVRSKRF